MIYLDNNATTAPVPPVREALVSTLKLGPLNASSIHQQGRLSRKIINEAREGSAEILGAKSSEVVFTSGGSEGVNLAVHGLATPLTPGKIISSRCEHSAVQKSLEALTRKGWEITWLPANERGSVTADQVENAIDSETRMVVLMWCNNETGVISEIEGIAKICSTHNLLFVVDAVAAFAKTEVSFLSGISALCLSGHKYHAPQGTGLCLFRDNLEIYPQIYGGGQEKNRRSGTHDVAGIAALYAAMLDFHQKKEEHLSYILDLRNQFEQTLIHKLGGVLVNGTGPRSVNTSNLAFEGIDGETLLIQLDQMNVCASHGSACHSGALSTSRVLLAMGLALDRAKSSLRFSFSRLNTQEEVDKAIEIICLAVQQQREHL